MTTIGKNTWEFGNSPEGEEKMSKKTELEFKCIELERYKHRWYDIKPAMLRPAYQYTSSECKDRTQLEMHEYDYLK